MSLKEFVEDLEKIDVSKCTAGKWYDEKKNCHCPIGQLAVDSGFSKKMSEYQFSWYYTIDIQNFINKKYGITAIDYSDFMESYDKLVDHKKGKKYAFQKGLEAIRKNLTGRN